MIGTVFANRYRIVGSLGTGGAGEVWRAFDENLTMEVALKLFPPGSPTIHAYTEASILTQLEGEHVLRVFNADTFQDIPFIATRIAAMGTSEDIRAANPRGLPADLVLTWIRQALVGLGACHDRGLLHRDIKPDNIFLDTLEFALLGDFERAHPLDASGTAPKEGSPFLMAPEMWTAGFGSVSSDIYSLSVTAYRLLTGTWPYDARTRAEIEPLVTSGRYVRLRELAPHVSRRLADRIERGMSLDPGRRFSTWREMHEELGRTGLVKRVFVPQRPSAGELSLWHELRRAHGQAVNVSVIDRGRAADIDVRYSSPAARRVPGISEQGVERRRLGVALRSLFDQLDAD